MTFKNRYPSHSSATLNISTTLKHTHTHTLTLSYAHTHRHTHTLTLTYAHTHTHAHTHTQTHQLTTMGHCGQSLVLSCTWSTSKIYAQTHTHTHTHIRTHSPPWDAVGSPWCCHVHGPPQKHTHRHTHTRTHTYAPTHHHGTLWVVPGAVMYMVHLKKPLLQRLAGLWLGRLHMWVRLWRKGF